MNLILLPFICMGLNGIYLIVAAGVPFESVALIGRAQIRIEPLNSRKSRLSTLLSGMLYLVVALAFGELFTCGRLGFYFKMWGWTIAAQLSL